MTRLRLVDPVADVGVLERAPLDRVEVDLAGEHPADEDPEAVAGTELAFPLAGRASGGERVGVFDDVGLTGQSLRLPLREPVRVATPDLLPLREVTRFEGTKQHTAAEQGRHGRST